MTDQPLTSDDFFAPDMAEVDHDLGNQLRQKFIELLDRLEEQTRLSAALESLTKDINKLKGDTIPQLMKEMGTDIYRDPESGKALELDLAVNSSLPKDIDKRNAVLSALRPLGIAEIMVEEFGLKFSPGDARVAVIRYLLGTEATGLIIDDGQAEVEAKGVSPELQPILDQLREALGELPADEKLGVHSSRFRSWLKEQINAGHGNEITEAGVWHGTIANVVEPKKKGKKK